jgi:hypothetical protein
MGVGAVPSGARFAPAGRALHDLTTGQMMDTTATEIRDRVGNVVGHIENRPNGDQILRDTDNQVRGYYDYKGDYTRDADQNIVAKGNKLRSLIC